MSKYLNDPREMAIRPESGVTLEEDNRVETMYHWGAKVLDLCGLPVEEYMKPMTVNTNGGGDSGGGSGGGGEKPSTRKVSMTVDIVNPDGDVISASGDVIENVEGDGNWYVRYKWDNDFNGVLASSVKAYDENNNEYSVEGYISDNQLNETKIKINASDSDRIVRIGDFGIGTNTSDTSNTTVTINDSDSNVDYVINIKPNSNQSVVDYDVLYGAKSKNESLSYEETSNFKLVDACDDDGKILEFAIPISERYAQESDLLDDGEPPYDGDDAMDLWEAWAEQYEAENRYTFRIYIPAEVEDNYTYQLYNENAGQYTPASLVKKVNTVTFDNTEFVEYVNEDDSYVFDDMPHSFILKLIINDK